MTAIHWQGAADKVWVITGRYPACSLPAVAGIIRAAEPSAYHVVYEQIAMFDFYSEAKAMVFRFDFKHRRPPFAGSSWCTLRPLKPLHRYRRHRQIDCAFIPII